MKQFETGLKLLEKACGNDKDNILSLATISSRSNKDGRAIPAVRDVDAYYEDGVFYVVTHAQSNKILEIAKNQEVAFSVNFANIRGKAIGENLGWVLDPKNAEIRIKLRRVFAKWYDDANDEKDPNFCYLAIHIKEAVIVKGHGANTQKYYLDFVNKRAFDEVKSMKERDAYYFSFYGADAVSKGKEYLFTYLTDNKIDLKTQTDPVYIFGYYDITKVQNEDFEYRICFIIPSHITLNDKPKIMKIFGGDFARRYTTIKSLETDKKEFYETIIRDGYHAGPMIVEQYLLPENKMAPRYKALMILPVEKV